MAQTIFAQQTTAVKVRTNQLLQAGLLALLGIGLFTLVSFASPSMMHNAAHDSRHGITVPCH